VTTEEHGTIATSLRLRIREKRIEDARAEYAWRRDPEVARYDGTKPLILSFQEFVQQFERDLRFANPTRRAYALETIAGEHIGGLMYYNADHATGTAEYGISIGPSDRRDAGLGTEATIAFLRFAWQALPLRHIYLHTLEWNVRAHRCFERAGFRDAGVTLRHGQHFMRMEAKREWWLLWDMEGRFDAYDGGEARDGRAAAEVPAGREP